MAEHSSVDASDIPDTSDPGFLIMSVEQATDGSEILDEDDDSDYLLRNAEKYAGIPPMPTKPQGAGLHPLSVRFGPESAPVSEENIKPDFYELTRVNESGLVEIDMKKLERKVALMTLNQITEPDHSQKEIDLQSLKEKVSKYDEISDKNGDENSAKQTEPEKDSSTEEQIEEKFTAFKYEKKNKLWDRKPHLKEMDRELLQSKSKSSAANSTEADPEDLLRRIAYPQLSEKHFLSEFPSGTLVKEDEPVENIFISVDHFEFLHKELPIRFLDLFKSKDFKSVAFDWEKDPQINNKVPSFIKFLEDIDGYKFPENCLTLILAILKNPYRKIEVFCDDKLHVVNEQVVIAEYLTNCLRISKIHEDAYEKLAKAIIRFANIHFSFLTQILKGFKAVLSEQNCGEIAYQIYCKALNLMASIGPTIIDVFLPLHFEKIFCLAAKDGNCDLYFHLLKACEISISNAIEHELQVKAEPSDDVGLDSESFDNDAGLDSEPSDNDVGLDLFYTACYNYFGPDLVNRLISIIKIYEKGKNKEERYLINKHAIYQTKNGYKDTTMRFLNNRYKNRAESQSSSFPTVKVYNFNSAGEVLFGSSNAQLGYVIQEDAHELLGEDFNYWTTIKEFHFSHLEDVTDKLKPRITRPVKVC